MNKFELKNLGNNIYHVRFKAQIELASTFLRFQEYYESPKFRGRVFSLEEFQKWYIQNSPNGKKTGKFTYFTDWNGFNIPSEIMDPFFQGSFDPLSDQEKILLETFRRIRTKKFYIIGTHDKGSNNNQKTLKHEIAHGLYYTNQTYYSLIQKLIANLDSSIKERLVLFLKNSAGYHDDVIEDEIQAYLVSGYEKLEKFGVSLEGFNEAHRKFEEVFNKFI